MCKILISIQPSPCELITSGIKTIELRKTRPKRKTPFKVYIYETKSSDTIFAGKPRKPVHLSFGRGMIIGEFVCNKVENIEIRHFTVFGHENRYTAVGENPDYQWLKKSCLSYDEVVKYGKLAPLYGWHISDLVIYDKPRELSEFYVEGDCDCMNCKKCAWFDRGNGYNVESDCNLAYKGVELHKSLKPITRPPQSWCYVESENSDEKT